MERSAGTHEGYPTADTGRTRAVIRPTKPVWRPLASYQPWPLDRVEPVAWRIDEVEP